jgi:hypothetical protein
MQLPDVLLTRIKARWSKLLYWRQLVAGCPKKTSSRRLSRLLPTPVGRVLACLLKSEP